METEAYDTVAVWQLANGDLFRYDGKEYILRATNEDDPDEENFIILTVEPQDDTESDEEITMYEFDEVELIRYV